MGARNSKRTLLKKITSLNLYIDQAVQIKALMEATGSEKEAPLLRQLIDEALAARRRKSVQHAEPEPPPPTQDISETLQTIQTLLLRMIGRGESTFQMQSVSLELLQEAVVEARGGRTSLWKFLVAPGLEEKGSSSEEVAKLFEVESDEVKEFVYSLAEEIKRDLDADDTDPTGGLTEDDRQGSFAYETENPEAAQRTA
jgi:hypothetical protein